MPYLGSKNLQNGIHVTVRYRDLSDDLCQSQWRLDPLLYKVIHLVRRKDNVDLVNAVERMARSKDGDPRQTLVPDPPKQDNT